MNARARTSFFAVVALAASATVPGSPHASQDCATVRWPAGQACLLLAQSGAGETPADMKTDSLPPAGLLQGRKTDRGGASTGLDSNAILVTRLIGQQAYSATGEELGRISDISLSPALQAEGAIIAVTGALGLRTKEVMVPTDALSVKMTEEGTPRLTIAWNREQIAAAPVFDRSALMR